MAKLTDLPTEVLQTIVRSLDTLYEDETGLTIFNIARVNRRLMSIAIDVHFNLVRPSFQPTSDLYQVESSSNWDDEKWKEMITKMLRHERCYINYTRSRARTRASHSECDHCGRSHHPKAEIENGSKSQEREENIEQVLYGRPILPQFFVDIMESG